VEGQVERRVQEEPRRVEIVDLGCWVVEVEAGDGGDGDGVLDGVVRAEQPLPVTEQVHDAGGQVDDAEDE